MLINGIEHKNGSAPYSMTQLENGSLLGTYGHNGWSRIFTISAADIADGGDVTATMGGTIDTTIEGAFTGCDGKIYLGDSGSNNVDAGGSIIRLHPNTLYNPMLGFDTVIHTEETDIDGLGPGIVGNKIVDSPGYALDSGKLLSWDYVSGNINQIGEPRVRYELHALGGEHFEDGQARLFGLQSHVFNVETIQLREINATVPNSSLVQDGPSTRASGLTGPMDCTESSIPPGPDTDGGEVSDCTCPEPAQPDPDFVCPLNSSGDVHITTPDNLVYDFQDRNDYILSHSTNSSAVMLQARQEAWPQRPNRAVAVNTAVAMNVAGDTLEFYLKPSPTFFINGAETPLPTSEVSLPHGGALILTKGGTNDFTVFLAR